MEERRGWESSRRSRGDGGGKTRGEDMSVRTDDRLAEDRVASGGRIIGKREGEEREKEKTGREVLRISSAKMICSVLFRPVRARSRERGLIQQRNKTLLDKVACSNRKNVAWCTAVKVKDGKFQSCFHSFPIRTLDDYSSQNS